jgi:hypothetical protein
VGQHEVQPKQDNDDQLIVNEVWDHGVPLSHRSERGPLYPVFERSELSAAVRDTTHDIVIGLFVNRYAFGLLV